MEPSRPSFPTSELDYELPRELIAQSPPARREDARMLVVDRAGGTLRDAMIVHLPSFLRRGDLLVLNDTKVVPARFSTRRATGGRVEALFLEERESGSWLVLLEGSRRLRVGERLAAAPPSKETDVGAVAIELVERLGEGQWLVRVAGEDTTEDVLERIGRTPLPPYIARDDNVALDAFDRRRYQTVYARVPGAVAAPTAGLHLTDHLLDEIRERGVEVAHVTLHVGMGTFKPVTVDDLADHAMHAERYEVGAATFASMAACRARGGRIVAVGTTAVRVLEGLPADLPSTDLRDVTKLLLYPPHRFRYVDALLTNFHLPRSTLLALVMAFAGIERMRDAYRHAIAQRYRFFSYGDAVLLL